jgi:hypothetical protein
MDRSVVVGVVEGQPRVGERVGDRQHQPHTVVGEARGVGVGVGGGGKDASVLAGPKDQLAPSARRCDGSGSDRFIPQVVRTCSFYNHKPLHI